MRETGKNGYQSKVRNELKIQFPDCEVRRLDPNDIQGSPDLIVLCPITWATLEVKGSAKSKKQPNQEYYVKKHDGMSFSNIIFPENEKEVFDRLHKHVERFNKGEGDYNDI